LVINARDAMPEGGRLLIMTRELVVDDNMALSMGTRPGIYTSLKFRDNGVGMDQVTAEKIFEPFFTTKEEGHGNGMGLASAYGAVRAMGGFITCETAPKQGTTLAIYLPRFVADAKQNPTSMQLKAQTGNETILLVDDNPAVLELIREALRHQGYQVLVASDGDEALRVVQSHPGKIDLLLTDLMLPGFNGQTLAVRLRAMRPNLRVVFSSGYSPDAFKPSSELFHAGFLAKPFTIDELARTVRAAIDS
jgi:two-component system, cell cycle sensor histidine kinase and response regulator CckA